MAISAAITGGSPHASWEKDSRPRIAPHGVSAERRARPVEARMERLYASLAPGWSGAVWSETETERESRGVERKGM
ncbi:hypothetical protein HPP92_012517 [Vanilla planifolia]|uniref:Uncharacterized protein n=1 Tax=Vanilla planifolia TaxID=51239 RepID=A0A835UZF9_VANPL|nr:hypothetical protein HPP92_012517 [Vanilla planifolia]